ncbi:unnamed protein product [Ilex paraguariensis]|uniref:Uncharacterized protein n=1 Tax=Ilex paraguariensis TaxID=185542 RepID=A0ABC8V0K9_9AQUA
MTMHFSRSLVSLSLQNRSHLHKPHISFSLSLLFFSSSTPKGSNSTITVSDYFVYKHQFSPETAAKVSTVLNYVKNPKKFDSILSYLKESGLSETHLEIVVRRMPSVLSANLDQTVKPKIKVFQELGISPTSIAEIISGNPRVLNSSTVNWVGPILALRNTLGSSFDVPKFLMACRWFLRYKFENTMLPNIELMKSLGISSSQIMSVENRLKPRLRVLEILENKELRRKKQSLTTICKMSNKKFCDKFVLPYSNEVGKIYV